MPDYSYPWQESQSKVIPKSAFSSEDNTVTLYAIWNKNQWHVRYYDGDETLIGDQTKQYNDQVTRGDGIDSPSKTGHQFAGWQIKSGITADKINESGQFTMPDNDVAFKATFTPNSHNVIYMVDDIPYATQPHQFGKTVTKGSGVTAPAKDNVIFKSWNLKSPSGLVITENTFTMPDIDVVFEAEFEDTYQVTYTAKKDGENYSLPETYKPERFAKDKEVTVKDNPPAIGGYTFSGWNVQSPDGVEISNGKFTMPASNVVICGEYTRNSYTVSYKAYNVNGSEISLDPSVYGTKNYNSGDEVTLAPVLTHDEYTFDGWKADVPDDLEIIQSAGGERSFTMPESNVVLTGRFRAGTSDPVNYTVTYRSGIDKGDDGYTEDLGKSYEFNVTADENGKADHIVLANDSPKLKYVRAGYTFAGWKLTKAQPDPHPAPCGKGTVVAPKAYAANGLYSSGDVITVDSSVVLTAQWTKKPAPDPENEPDNPPSPGTGESTMPIAIAFNLAILSILATGTVMRRRTAR